MSSICATTHSDREFRTHRHPMMAMVIKNIKAKQPVALKWWSYLLSLETFAFHLFYYLPFSHWLSFLPCSLCLSMIGLGTSKSWSYIFTLCAHRHSGLEGKSIQCAYSFKSIRLRCIIQLFWLTFMELLVFFYFCFK